MEFRAFDIENSESYINAKGYVLVWVGHGKHPYESKGYCRAHRLVMEAHLGRFIEPHETVHHINEVKTDNRLENLYLCSEAEHTAIHNRERKPTLAQKSKIRKGVRRSRNMR